MDRRRARVRLSLDVSAEVNDEIERLAAAMDLTKSELLRRAVIVMGLVVDAHGHGEALAIVDRDGAIVARVLLV